MVLVEKGETLIFHDNALNENLKEQPPKKGIYAQGIINLDIC